MTGNESSNRQIEDIRKALVESGYFHPGLFGEPGLIGAGRALSASGLESVLEAAKNAQADLGRISEFLHKRLVLKILELEHTVEDPAVFDRLGLLLEKVLDAAADFKREPGFVTVYGELLSVYTLVLYRRGSPGRENPLMKMILTNRTRRKAVEFSQTRLEDSFERLERTVTIAVIAKRRAVYVVATRGLKILFRSEIDFRTFGKAPENLALQITNILLRNGIKLTEVTDLVCAGGDLGPLPDGIYVLDQKVRDESLKRLGNSSLNRGALVLYELKEILKAQGDQSRINLSLASPLSFATLDTHEISSCLRVETSELSQDLKGYVKVTPLKAIAAIISEIEKTSPDNMNLLVMTLDELFASVVRKIGPHIVREMAAQDANSTLSRFDFAKIVDLLHGESFIIPAHFRLGSKEMGTGVKEICELLMVIESGRISPSLAQGLMHIVDTYARRVAMIIEMASTGLPSDRPHFVVIASTMVLDHYFLRLFAKIRSRIENPFTPVMCLDSLEHEYLIAAHLFELYVNPVPGEKRLLFSLEERSVRHALQVLRTPVGEQQAFAFSALLEKVTGAMSEGRVAPGNIVLVGADNEEALGAMAEAKEFGLLKRLVLIGDPEEIRTAAERTRIRLDPRLDPDVEILPTDPLAIDFESKKKSMADVFYRFIQENPDFIIMKGSLGTAELLHKALEIYKSAPEVPSSKADPARRLASSTALFVLPDGRFFALSDAAVNPGFGNPRALLTAIENEVDVVRKVVDPRQTLKVAIITAVEKQTAAIPATFLAAQAVELAGALEDAYGPLVVEGPLSFDLATAPDVVEEKHYEGRIRGDANCLMATDINTANVLYKMLTKTMGSLGLMVENGAIITAGPGTVPIVLCSRGDTAQTKFNSILLAFAYSCLKKGGAFQ